MWSALLRHLSTVELALTFAILYFRPRAVALLLAVLVALLPRDKRSRPDRAIDVVRALQRDTRRPDWRRRRRLPPGSPP
jgi:hypothetical protein